LSRLPAWSTPDFRVEIEARAVLPDEAVLPG
jgi:hypothetical protein